jgi:polyisoprenoid-binding protein YceI
VENRPIPIRFARRRAALLLALPLAAGCAAPGQRAAPAVGPSPTPAAPTTAAGAAGQPTTTVAAPPAGALVFRVITEQSKATFRVREQLVGVELPSDAVGTTGAVGGQLALRPDGTLVSEASKITVDLRELKTDDPRRDNFIKQNTLQTSRFPFAEFVPTQAEGLPSPLPASGEHAFRLTGNMTVHGVQKAVGWDVRARRDAAQLAGRATTTLKFGDFGMAPPRVPVVVSVVDEIRLELDLVAAQAT